MTKLEKILDRFEKEFYKVTAYKSNSPAGKKLKSFITQELTSAFTELVEKIEGEGYYAEIGGVRAGTPDGKIISVSKCITILESWMK